MQHTPVLSHEVVELLAPEPGALILDGTVGGGGHASLLLARAGTKGRLLGIDRDTTALARAREHLAPYGTAVRLIHGNYADMIELLGTPSLKEASVVLLDLGLSSFQVDAPDRGISFRVAEAPLDMRMDGDAPQMDVPVFARTIEIALAQMEGLTAAQVLNAAPAELLIEVFRRYGELSGAHRLAAAIVARRAYRTVADLLETLSHTLPRGPRGNAATAQVFQALRIAVNGELRALDRFLGEILPIFSPGTRIGVISFHSLEDRRVKQTFRAATRDCICPIAQPRCSCGGDRSTLRLLTPRAIMPSQEEIAANPRARSARLRVALVN